MTAPQKFGFFLSNIFFQLAGLWYFMYSLQKEVLCALIQIIFGVAFERLLVTAEASAYSHTVPNVTSFRTRTSDQTMALCVAAFSWCNFDCLYRSSQAATGWLIVSRLVLSVFTCPDVVLVPLIFSFVSPVPTALQRFVYARIVTCLSFLSFALVVPSTISNNLRLFHCLYLSHFLFVDLCLVYLLHLCPVSQCL